MDSGLSPIDELCFENLDELLQHNNNNKNNSSNLDCTSAAEAKISLSSCKNASSFDPDQNSISASTMALRVRKHQEMIEQVGKK